MMLIPKDRSINSLIKLLESLPANSYMLDYTVEQDEPTSYLDLNPINKANPCQTPNKIYKEKYYVDFRLVVER